MADVSCDLRVIELGDSLSKNVLEASALLP